MWAAMFGIDVSERLNDHLAQMKKVPSVARALAGEGLASAPSARIDQQLVEVIRVKRGVG